jgi:hypothetical protein
MTAWGRTHRTLFYTLYSKLISQPAQQTNVNVNVHHTNEDPRKSLEQAFLRVIAARKAGGADPAVIVDGERVYDAAPHGAAVVVDARANRELPAPASKAAPRIDDAPPQPAAPANVVPLRSVTRSSHNATRDAVPGLSAGVALDGLDDRLSTTERFMLWRGHGRPP